jgi:hypothetical protein
LTLAIREGEVQSRSSRTRKAGAFLERPLGISWHIDLEQRTACKFGGQSAPPPMARKALQNDQIVKLIVGAGQASPSPPVGPALGSKGVKSMDFCKVCHSRLSIQNTKQGSYIR